MLDLECDVLEGSRIEELTNFRLRSGDVFDLTSDDDMSGEDVAFPVDGPAMNVVNGFDAVNRESVALKGFDAKSLRCGLEENGEDFLEISPDIPEDENRDSDRENWVNDRKIANCHDTGPNEDRDPAERVLDEVPAHEFLCQRRAAPNAKDCRPVEEDPEDGKADHARGVDRGRIEEPGDRVTKDKAEADKKEKAGDEPAEEAVAAVAVSVARGSPFLRKPVEIPGETEGDGIPEIVNRIGQDRDAVRPDPADDLQQSEPEVEKERNLQVLTAVRMIVGHRKSGSMFVIAGAGILLVRALGALDKIEIELLGYLFRLRSRGDCDDNREVVAFRKRDVGDKDVALFSELHPGRVGAVPSDDADLLGGDGLEFLIVADRGDAYFAIVGHEELEVRFDRSEEASSVRSVLNAGVIVVVIVAVFFLFVFGVVVVFFIVRVIGVIGVIGMFFFRAGDGGESKCRGGEEEAQG